jgi:heat shock protein HslJ
MMCETTIMTQESIYLEALQAAKSYSILGDQLSLIKANKEVSAIFKAQKQDLAGTSWEVITYNNGKQAVTSVLAGTSISADFGADGKLSGKSGCNSYNGSYKVDGSKISIGPIASTKMFCSEPAGVMEQESQYLLALESAATYTIEGSSLELRTQDGALAVQLAGK